MSIRAAAPITPDEVAWLRGQRMNEGLRTNAGGALSKGYDVELDRAVDLPRGSVIASTRRMGNGFVIDRCTFGFNRSRGILIKASRGTISGCTLEGSQEVGILVAPEWWWLEAGSASDLVITGNTIANCPTPGIVVKAIGGNGRVGPAGGHKNIRIAGNRFENVAFPCILCTSTEGLDLADNRFPTEPGPQATWGAELVPAADRGKPVVTVECSDPKEASAPQKQFAEPSNLH